MLVCVTFPNVKNHYLSVKLYSDRLVRGQILKVRKFSRLVELKQKRNGNKSRFVFNITYYPVFSKLKKCTI